MKPLLTPDKIREMNEGVEERRIAFDEGMRKAEADYQERVRLAIEQVKQERATEAAKKKS